MSKALTIQQLKLLKSNTRLVRAHLNQVPLVPKQYSTGGQQPLYGITKQGDAYLRSLVVSGARAVVRTAKNKQDSLSRWALAEEAKLVHNRGVVARQEGYRSAEFQTAVA